MSRIRLFVLAVVAAAGMLMVAACGGDDSSSTDAEDAADSVPAVAATAAPVEDTEAPAARNPYGDACGDASSATTAPASTAAPPSTAVAAPAPAAAVQATESPLGTILIDAAGLTVYGFTQDAAGTPTCTGGCADNWPPVTVDGDALPAGLDPVVFSVVERSDGTYQLKAGEWPLYRFAGDAAPGDTNGQAAGGVWFVVAPDGTLIE
jgi:predicted lipoprotein with Yx(FWY)xxD motif